MDDNKQKPLKNFFIKLVSISLAIIIIMNVLFNLLISDKLESFDSLLSLTEIENRKEYGEQLRDDLRDLLKKDEIIKQEDKILLYNLYQKLKLEFKEIN
jgi:hypothetical protein